MDFDLKGLLSTIAPALASALGGPLAGAAVAFIGDKFGISEPTQEKISAVLAGSKPEDLLKVKQLDADFKAHMAQLGVDVFKLEVQDRADARALVRDHAAITWGMFALSLVILVVGFGTELYVLKDGYPHTVPEVVVGRILGMLDSSIALVLAYWYGTTRGSAEKDATIKSLSQ